MICNHKVMLIIQMVRRDPLSRGRILCANCPAEGVTPVTWILNPEASIIPGLPR